MSEILNPFTSTYFYSTLDKEYTINDFKLDFTRISITPKSLKKIINTNSHLKVLNNNYQNSLKDLDCNMDFTKSLLDDAISEYLERKSSTLVNSLVLLFNSTRKFVREKELEFRTLNLYWEDFMKEINWFLSVEEYLFKNNREQYTYYRTLKDLIRDSKTNIVWCESYYQKFLMDYELSDLKKCVDLLSTILKFKVTFSNTTTGYVIPTSNFYSKNKFCAFSKRILAQQKEEKLVKTLTLLDKQNITHSFLTLSYKNLKYLSNSDLKNSYKINKEFWRTKITLDHFVNKDKKICDIKLYHTQKHHIGKYISDIFTGYYGVPEIKEKGDDYWNFHYHFIVTRAKSKSEGYLDLRLISNAFKQCCLKFGESKFHNSFSSNIQSPHIWNPNKKLGAVRYIHKYLSKGLDVESSLGRLRIIDTFKDIKMFRTGGLLSERKLNVNLIETTALEGVTTLLNNHQYNLHIPIKLGGEELNYNRIRESFNLSPKLFTDFQLNNYSTLELKNVLLYGHKLGLKGLKFNIKNTFREKYYGGYDNYLYNYYKLRTHLLNNLNFQKLEILNTYYFNKSDLFDKYKKDRTKLLKNIYNLFLKFNSNIKFDSFNSLQKRYAEFKKNSLLSLELKYRDDKKVLRIQKAIMLKLSHTNYRTLLKELYTEKKNMNIKFKKIISKQLKTIKPTDNYYSIKESLLGSVPYLDPLFKDEKLSFNGCTGKVNPMWWDHPLFIVDAFKSKGLDLSIDSISENCIEPDKIINSFVDNPHPNNIDTLLIDNDLEVDYLSLLSGF